MQAQSRPTEILLTEDVLDLAGERTLKAGDRATVGAGFADGLVGRGAAKRLG